MRRALHYVAIATPARRSTSPHVQLYILLLLAHVRIN